MMPSIFNAPLILASKSTARQALLKNAGFSFAIQSADLDEAQMISGLTHQKIAADEIALHLAISKAEHVSKQNPQIYTLGGDQLLICEDQIYSKPEHRPAAIEQLLQLSGRKHELYSAAALILNEEIIITALSKARLTLRKMSRQQIEHYLDLAGSDVLQCVGSYQLEGAGIHLFDHIEGDYWTILGLPLLELSRKMRELNLLAV
jgi:septum formation protein